MRTLYGSIRRRRLKQRDQRIRDHVLTVLAFGVSMTRLKRCAHFSRSALTWSHRETQVVILSRHAAPWLRFPGPFCSPKHFALKDDSACFRRRTRPLILSRDSCRFTDRRDSWKRNDCALMLADDRFVDGIGAGMHHPSAGTLASGPRSDNARRSRRRSCCSSRLVASTVRQFGVLSACAVDAIR